MQPVVDKLPPNPFLPKHGGYLMIEASQEKVSVSHMDFSEKLMHLSLPFLILIFLLALWPLINDD